MAEADFKTWLGELKTKCDIVSVFSKYCHVVSKGRNYWTCCPFHMEKTPSLCIYDIEQTFHCYGCKEHGDVIRFVMKMESCDFLQAVEILAKSVGMEIPNFSSKDADGIDKRKKEKDKVLECLQAANAHYQENLYKSIAKPAQDYIKKRKMTKRELDNFNLGYSIDYTEIITHLKSKGFSEDVMQKAGIIDKGAKGGYYDHFAYRLLFPIYNIYGECVGFSGRILTNDKTKAKYKNSPATIVFDKSNTVFGLNLVRKYKQSEAVDKTIIVEGQMDVIAMHKAGFINSVACLGTAFTSQHAKQLKLISNNVTCCLDGDKAGQNATNKMVDILAENGFNVKVVKIPNGKDPDEYINEFGKESLAKLIDEAQDYIDFKIDYIADGVDFKKSDQKAKFVRGALDILNTLKTNSEKQVYLKHIKDLSGVPIDVLRNDLTLNNVSQSNVETQNEIQNLEDGSNRAIKFILAAMLYKKEFVKNNVNIRPYLHNNTYIKLYEYMLSKRQKNEIYTVSSLYDEFDVDNEPNLIDIINYNFEQIGNNEKYYEECLWSLAEKHLKNQQAKLNEEFSSCSDLNERKKILLEISKITQKLKNKEMEE